MVERVLVGMSGGVDSSVAALLLKQRGYDVIGAHMKLWDYAEVGGETIYRDGRCCSHDSINHCRLVCDRLDIPFYVLNLSVDFEREIIDNFVAEYRAGQTPNPCVRCNTLIKWEGFLRKADELACDYIATGHYARILRADGRHQLHRGIDKSRDQSYVLWGLDQAKLQRTLMPLGDITKAEVRQVARHHGLRTAEAAESREICFVADDDYPRFLREWSEREGGPDFETGEIMHENGTILGEHRGTPFYTIGQRRGLGIAWSEPLYVIGIDAVNNRLIVGPDTSLWRTEMGVEQVNWIAGKEQAQEFEASVQIRYQHTAAPARVCSLTDGSLHVTLTEKQRAITPGQSAVMYDRDRVLGGGIIAR